MLNFLSFNTFRKSNDSQSYSCQYRTVTLGLMLRIAGVLPAFVAEYGGGSTKHNSHFRSCIFISSSSVLFTFGPEDHVVMERKSWRGVYD